MYLITDVYQHYLSLTSIRISFQLAQSFHMLRKLLPLIIILNKKNFCKGEDIHFMRILSKLDL